MSNINRQIIVLNLLKEDENSMIVISENSGLLSFIKYYHGRLSLFETTVLPSGREFSYPVTAFNDNEEVLEYLRKNLKTDYLHFIGSNRFVVSLEENKQLEKEKEKIINVLNDNTNEQSQSYINSLRKLLNLI